VDGRPLGSANSVLRVVASDGRQTHALAGSARQSRSQGRYAHCWPDLPCACSSTAARYSCGISILASTPRGFQASSGTRASEPTGRRSPCGSPRCPIERLGVKTRRGTRRPRARGGSTRWGSPGPHLGGRGGQRHAARGGRGESRGRHAAGSRSPVPRRGATDASQEALLAAEANLAPQAVHEAVGGTDKTNHGLADGKSAAWITRPPCLAIPPATPGPPTV